MIVLGLTGSIGMGKSTTARMLRSLNIPVFDADAWVHRALNKKGAAVPYVRQQFPQSYRSKTLSINRSALGRQIFHDKKALKKLEAILHPLVRAAEIRFIQRHLKKKISLVVLDIPLLFETKAEVLCDYVLCVEAPPAVERARVLRRKGMTPEKFQAILKSQWSNNKKKQRADYVLSTAENHAATRRDLQKIIKSVLNRGHARNRP